MSFESYAARIEAAVDKAENGSEILFQVANGDEFTEVSTTSGPVPSVKKWFLDNREQIADPRTNYAILVYSTYAEASSAAATLPDGQLIKIETDETHDDRGTLNVIQNGAVVFVDYAPDTVLLQSYTALRAYTGKSFSVELTAPGIAGRFNRDTSDTTTADNGGTVIVDGSGRRWKRAFSGDVLIAWFGPNGMATVDDAPKIAAAIAAAGKRRVNCAGINLGIGTTLVLPDGAALDGGNFSSTLVALPTLVGDMVQSANFTTLTGTTDAFAAGVPETVRMDGFIVQGNYQNEARTAYIRTSGHGVRVFVRKPFFNLRIFNVPGIGFLSECPGGNGPTPLRPGYSRQAGIHLYVHGTKEEGVIWWGPPDVPVAEIFQTAAGSRIAAEDELGKVPSPTYGSTNGGQTDGVVIDKTGGEFGLVHSWGNYAGGGVIQYAGRLNADLLISESCLYGGCKLMGGFGQIGRLDVHRVGGWLGDTTSDFIHASPGSGNVGHQIGSLAVTHQSPLTDRAVRNRVQLQTTSRFLKVAEFLISANNLPGHGLVIDAGAAFYDLKGGMITLCRGTAGDSTPSAAVFRNTTGFGSIEAQVINCDNVFRSGAAPTSESISISFTCQSSDTAFSGTARTNNGQNWNISGVLGTTYKGSKWQGALTFNSAVAGVQTASATHGLISAPGFGRITAALVDTDTRMSPSAKPTFLITEASATQISAEFEISTPTGSNTTPRVWVTAEV